MALNLHEFIHAVLAKTPLDILVSQYNMDDTEYYLKKMIRSKSTGYKANMVRAKGREYFNQFLTTHYPKDEYPEKYI